jgi:malonate decarboxylase delta subunit
MSTGLEHLQFNFVSGQRPPAFAPVLVGVVGSGNLEVLLEAQSQEGCQVEVETSARGFDSIWAAVLQDFHERFALSGVRVSIHDMGATPAVVSLRLQQAVAALPRSPA